MKCLNCGEEHYSTSQSCKVWMREKEITTIKYCEGLSFAEARKIVDARQALSESYSSVTKSKATKSVTLKDAQTQTNDASVQTDPNVKETATTQKPQKSPANDSKKPENPIRNKSPYKSSDKVLSDRLPKGSDDPIQQHNHFHCLNEDMEAEDGPAETTNKQDRIIKLNNKK